MLEITLAGKTQKGKNRVREHGQTWHVMPVKSDYYPNKVLLESPRTKYVMWVDLAFDKNFETVIKEIN
jgi:hypothetical protein